MNRLSPSYLLFGVLAGSALLFSTADAFTFPSSSAQVGGMSTIANVQHRSRQFTGSRSQSNLFMAEEESGSSGSSGVVELTDDDEDDATAPAAAASPAAPFLSQGEISMEEALNPDLSDPKQTRVILYIILSLVPVLFLIPLMLGSRDLIPLDSLPPVDLS
uniref:Transmembrane protein n=1 Tax=Minutocellus polymorphus TaxID=265543 RepID=A0A7S0FG54_9STRA